MREEYLALCEQQTPAGETPDQEIDDDQIKEQKYDDEGKKDLVP